MESESLSELEKISSKKINLGVKDLIKKISAIIDPIIDDAEDKDIYFQIENLFILFYAFCHLNSMTGKLLYEFSKLEEVLETNIGEKLIEAFSRIGQEIFGKAFKVQNKK